MRLVIFGASGGVGQHLVTQALEQGHEVTAVARHLDTLPAHERLTLQPGNVYEPASFADALAGKDVVLSALGLRQFARTSTLFSEGGSNILHAMEAAGVRRLITITSAMAEPNDPHIPWFWKFFVRGLLLPGVYADEEKWEAILKSSALDWIVVRPMTLGNGPRTGTYRVSPRFAPPKSTAISRADVADFMLKQLTDDRYLRQYPTLSY